jgi:hypothetical protein
MFETRVVDVFEKHFPKLCDNPALHMHKDEIRSITMNVLKDMFGMNDRPWKRHQETMPYHEEL